MQPESEQISIGAMRLLSALMKTRRLSLAADMLGLSVSTASRQLAVARMTFEDDLFIRSQVGYTPTDRMYQLGERIDAILFEIDTLNRMDVFNPSDIDLTVRIMSADSGLFLFLLEPIAKMRNEAPRLRFEIQPLAENMFERLKADQTDLLIFPRSQMPTEFAYAPLCAIETVALVRNDHPLVTEAINGQITKEVIANYPLIDVDPTSGLRGFTYKVFESTNARPAISLPYFGMGSLFLQSNHDVVLTPVALAKHLIERHPVTMLRFIDGDAPSFTPHLIWHRRIHANPAMQWIRAQILATSREV